MKKTKRAKSKVTDSQNHPYKFALDWNNSWRK